MSGARKPRNERSDSRGLPARFAALIPRLGDIRGSLRQPIQNCLHLERLQIRFQRQNARRDAGQMRSSPTSRRLLGERTEIAAAMRLKLNLFAQLIREV